MDREAFKKEIEDETTKVIGWCPVDSASLMLIDPMYLDNWEASDEWQPLPLNELILGEVTREEVEEEYDLSDDERAAVASCEHPNQAGEVFIGGRGDRDIPSGICTSTGLGDGLYPVVAHYVDDETFGRRVARVEVIFLPEDEKTH